MDVVKYLIIIRENGEPNHQNRYLKETPEYRQLAKLHREDGDFTL